MKHPNIGHFAKTALAFGILFSAPIASSQTSGADSYLQATEEKLSVEFSACEQASDHPPVTSLNRVTVSVDQLEQSLHGVWIGMRYTPGGKQDDADYLMVFNMEASEQLIYEERGAGVQSNAFMPHFEQALRAKAQPLTITYLYCDGVVFPVFKDVFTKVSDNPDDAIAALREVTGIADLKRERYDGRSNTTLTSVWETMKRVRYFERRARVNTKVNAGMHTVSAVPFNHSGTDITGIRLDFVGQLRGSPNKGYTPGRPAANVEGGIFTGLVTDAGAWLGTGCSDGCHGGGGDLGVRCTGDFPPGVSPEMRNPFASFYYNRVVIGPLQSLDAPAGN
ncbi:MAG: hypothetical protein AAFX85_05980 [Pseudomonadota bacterium]